MSGSSAWVRYNVRHSYQVIFTSPVLTELYEDLIYIDRMDCNVINDRPTILHPVPMMRMSWRIAR